MAEVTNLGSPFEKSAVDVLNDTGMVLSAPNVEALAIQKFYMPDFQAVQPLSNDEGFRVAMNLDYDGWDVDVGHDGTKDVLPLPTETRQLADPKQKGSFWGAAKAGAVQENELLSYAANKAAGTIYKPLEGYDPQNEDAYSNPVYAPYAKDLVFAESPEEFGAMISQIDSELERRQMIADNVGGGLTGMMAGQVLSPLFWLSMLAPEVGAVRLGRPVRAAAEFLAYGAAQESAAELIKMESQLTRTQEEALINIGASALLSGAIGGGVAIFSKAEMGSIIKKTVDDLSTDKPIVRAADYGDVQKLTQAELDAMKTTPGKAY